MDGGVWWELFGVGLSWVEVGFNLFVFGLVLALAFVMYCSLVS